MRNRRSDRGIALIVVLFLSSLLTLLMYTFLKQMEIEYSLSNGYGQEKQAEQLAWSAIEKAIVTLTAEATPVAGPSSPWYDNSTDWFETEMSYADPSGTSVAVGVVSMIRASTDPDGKCHFGLADESGKINLNGAPREVIMKLPRMTDEIADAILDWRDQDDKVTNSGAENSYYQSQTPPYSCKNGTFDTVEELLLVKGVTPELLYGEDLNRNGVLDKNEDDGDKSPPADTADGVLDFGWISYITVYSYDKNTRIDGSARVNINSATAQQLQQALSDVLSAQELQQIPTRRTAMGGFKSPAHLLTVKGVPQPGIPVDKWKKVVDRVCILDGETVPGLLNINTAGRVILEMLPGLTGDDVAKMLSHRTQPGVDLSTIGWLADAVDPDKIQQFAAFVTTRAYQFRFDAVARIGPKSTRSADETSMPTRDLTKAAQPARVIRRIVAIWDRGGQRPRLIYVRDVSRLGMPYPVVEPN